MGKGQDKISNDVNNYKLEPEKNKKLAIESGKILLLFIEKKNEKQDDAS
jgi:hypothetical protein